jgi:hypothetical protein
MVAMVARHNSYRYTTLAMDRAHAYVAELTLPFELYGSDLLLGTLAWIALQIILYIVCFRVSFANTAAARLELSEKLVSIIHAAIIAPWVIYILFTDGIARWDDVRSDPTARNANTHAAITFSATYFLWDVIISVVRIQQHQGLAFIVHALCCTFAHTQALRPFMQFFACATLLCELSTPWLHIRSLLISLQRTDTVFFKITQYLFAFWFFVARILGQGVLCVCVCVLCASALFMLPAHHSFACPLAHRSPQASACPRSGGRLFCAWSQRQASRPLATTSCTHSC